MLEKRTVTEADAEAAALVEARGVTRTFRSGRVAAHALRDVSLAVRLGELVALQGRSGAGKTTLINILTGLDDPTEGQVLVFGARMAGLDERARARLRRERIGMLFQNPHLFPLLTAQENVELPLRLTLTVPAERAVRAREMLERVGLGEWAHHRGLELSGGEQQRVALARALVHQPRFVVADEPTGNLDTLTSRAITTLLRDTAHELGIGLLVATHDAAVAAAADRVLQLRDGMLEGE